MKPNATKLDFRSRGFDFASFAFTSVTGLATLFILGVLAVIIANIAWHGWETFSWRFLTGSADQDMFDVKKAGVLPMVIGTALRVMTMTLFVSHGIRELDFALHAHHPRRGK
jgi:ABC-type phosphate transport system permease subunit